LENSPLTVNIEPSKISPKDFAAFMPLLKDFSDVVEISADISGFINSISINKLILSYGNDISFSGNMDLKGLANKEEELYLFGRIKDLSLTTEGLRKINANFGNNGIRIPKLVMNVGDMKFNGEISGFVDNMVAFGNLTSPVGSIQMDMMIGSDRSKGSSMILKGNVASSNLQINSLFAEGNPFGKVGFNATVDLVQSTGRKVSGAFNAQINEMEFKDYNYGDIYVSGKFKENEYGGLLQVNDPNGKFEIQGLFFNEKEKPVFDFMAEVSGFRPDKLHLTEKFDNPEISLAVNAKFTGNNPDDFDGFIRVQDLAVSSAKDSFRIKDLRVETTIDEKPFKALTISSDIIKGEIKGEYLFSSLVRDLCKTAGIYLPSLINSIGKGDSTASGNNNFDFSLAIDNCEHVSNTLDLPVAILEKTNISGYYKNATNSILAEADVPSFRIGKTPFKNGYLRIDNRNDTVNMQLDVSLYNKKNVRNYFNLKSSAKEDNVYSTLYWTNDKSEKFESEIIASALFAEDAIDDEHKKLRTEITVQPSTMILKDTAWNIGAASMTVSGGRLFVDNFYITNENQSLHLDGIISESPKDVLRLDLNDIETEYIFDILNIPVLQFGGRVTGYANARDLPGNKIIEGRLEIQDFSFNDAVQGKLNISSEWDNYRQGIQIMGTIYKSDSIFTDVHGQIFPVGAEKGLSLFFDANEINATFVQKYLDAFADSVSGLVYGTVHLYGDFTDMFVVGNPYIKDGKMRIKMLNSTYSFSDTVFIDTVSIRTNNTAVYDKDGNSGSVTFNFNHDNFKDLRFGLDVKADKMLVYNVPERANPKIYGQIYASGTARLSGTDENLYVEGNVQSAAGTSVGFNFLENSTVEDYDFISFVDKKEDMAHNKTNGNGKNDVKRDNDRSGMDYQLNFLINATPDANFELMIDPAGGDRIKGNGSGNLQVQYGNLSDIQIFGNYLISNGTYNFSLQQLLHKRFNIRDGSLVSFHGSPMTANLDINAIYNLTANIQDLEETLIMETANTNVPVNCVLQLDGQLRNPNITFDLELPNSNSELERQVKSFIDTEDMMTRQIIYLMVLNKFYTPDYSRNDFRTNEFSAVATSAISAQLSNILSSFTDKVQIGTNIRSRQDGIKDTEVEMLLSSRLLNNRLIFNGNFGYKDNYIQSNAFVGEFDLEYKLSRSGEISLKAYNHANDLYRYNTKSLTRQGVGITLGKDFTTLYDIFRRRKKKETVTESEEPE
jgi:hypothetical protein